MTSRRQVLGVLGALALPFPARGDQTPAFPYGMVFVADSLDGELFADASRPTLRISMDGRAQGTSGCNRYSGMAMIEGEKLSFGPLAMTRMACFGAGGENERRFAPAIASARSWRLDRRMLVIETASGALRFRRR